MARQPDVRQMPIGPFSGAIRPLPIGPMAQRGW